MASQRYIARSASDNTDDWSFWMVWDTERNLNVTGTVARELGIDWRPGSVLTDRESAEHLSAQINR